MNPILSLPHWHRGIGAIGYILNWSSNPTRRCHVILFASIGPATSNKLRVLEDVVLLMLLVSITISDFELITLVVCLRLSIHSIKIVISTPAIKQGRLITNHPPAQLDFMLSYHLTSDTHTQGLPLHMLVNQPDLPWSQRIKPQLTFSCARSIIVFHK